MAIAIVQSKHVQTGLIFSSTLLTDALAAGPTQNNLLVFWFVFSGDSGTVTRPSGWSSLGDAKISGGGQGVGVHYKLAGASEPTQWTWSTTDEIQAAAYGIIELSGVDTSTPIDVAGSFSSESFGSGEVAVAAITTVTAAAWHFASMHVSGSGGFSMTTGSGYTEWEDSTRLGIYYKEIASPGSTGTLGITNSGGSEDRRVFSFAVRPSGGGGGGGGGNPWYAYAQQR